jgi:hypothetical protein
MGVESWLAGEYTFFAWDLTVKIWIRGTFVYTHVGRIVSKLQIVTSIHACFGFKIAPWIFRTAADTFVCIVSGKSCIGAYCDTCLQDFRSNLVQSIERRIFSLNHLHNCRQEYWRSCLGRCLHMFGFHFRQIFLMGIDRCMRLHFHTSQGWVGIFGHIFGRLGLRKDRMRQSMIQRIIKNEDHQTDLRGMDWCRFLTRFI